MSLLRYEYIDANETSFNGRLGQLVKDIRHYYSYAPLDEFKAAMPRLHTQEQHLNKLNAEMGMESKNYIQDIMEELKQESDLEEGLLQDFEYSCNAIATALLNKTISLDMFSYSFRIDDAVPWLTFEGYTDQRDMDALLIIAKDTFKTICYKRGVIFIDMA